MLNKLRDPVSGLTHLGATVVAIVAVAILLFLGRDSATKLISLAVYGLSLILMFAASTAYHLVDATPQVVGALRKLDHSAIYCLIAGTYTPICLHFFQGFWQWGFVGIIWSLAAAGITVKLFMMKAPRWLAAGIYLLMGWLALIAIPEIVKAMPVPALAWLLAGGIFFTVGAVIYIIKKPDFFPKVFGFHEVWHIFVILGCACHFIVIAAFVAPHATT
ncbi:MAG: hemolysin III family protein [Thermoflexales bacterium]|nr:hemolysin III family protein [Thermoflexales bacterium]